MGLLDYLTATALDEDYAHVSAQRQEQRREQGQEPGGPGTPRSGRPDRPGRPGLVALAVLAVFGVLVATAAVRTSRDADESATSRTSLVRQVNTRKAALVQRRAAVRSLRSEVATARVLDDDLRTQGRTVTARTTRLGLSAGTDDARGPGIRVRVDDAPGTTSVSQQVQAPDLQKLVNGLWQVGAEAISVNGQRLTARSSIRDAGAAVTVNYVSLRRPYTISALGNPKTMGARLLDTAGGQAWVTLQSFGLQFDVDTEDSMLLPARPVTLRSAHVPAGAR